MFAEYLAGVVPEEPGYSTVKIRPLIGYLDFGDVDARVPTLHGTIEVR